MEENKEIGRKVTINLLKANIFSFILMGVSALVLLSLFFIIWKERKSMDEISREIGFSNRQSFYAAFYKYVGVTPREYRLAHNQSYAVIVSEREKKRAKKKE